MIDQNSRQAIIDDEHLKVLSLGYLISGVMTALFSLMGLVYAAMGVMIGTIAPSTTSDPPPEFMGAFFAIFGGVFFLSMVGLAISKFMAATYLKKRKHRNFCLVVAGISCFGVPYGTLLGVYTFIVLGRKSVLEKFNPLVPS